MIDLKKLTVKKAHQTEQGEIVSPPDLNGWYLRCMSGDDTQIIDVEQWLVDLSGANPFTMLMLGNVSNDATAVLKSYSIKVDIAESKTVFSSHGMSGWLMLVDDVPAVVVKNPTSFHARDLIVNFNGEIIELATGKSALAFANWKIVMGKNGDPIVSRKSDKSV